MDDSQENIRRSHAQMQRQLSLRHWFTMLILLAGMIAYDIYDYMATWRRAEENISSIARLADEHLSKTVSETYLLLSQVAYRVGLEGEPEFARQSHLRTILVQEVPGLTHLRSLSIVNSQGEIVAATHQELPAPVQVKDLDYFQYWLTSGKPALFIGTPIKARVTNRSDAEWIMTFTLPIRDSRGRFLGIALATIDPSYFARIYGAIDIDHETQISIVRHDGILLARTPPAENRMGKPLSRDAVFREGLNRSDTGVLRHVSIEDDTERMSAFRRLTDWPLALIVERNAEDINGQWAQRTIYIALLIAFFMVLLTRMHFHQRNQLQISEAASKALKENEKRFRTLFYEAPVGNLLSRLSDGAILDANPAFCEITGYSRDELCRMTHRDLTSESQAESNAMHLAMLKSAGCYGPSEKQCVRKDGSLVPIRSNGSLVSAPGGEIHLLSIVEDISERRRTETRIRLLASVFEHSGEGFLLTDHENRIVEVNSSFTRITGYLPEEVIGQSPSMLSSGRSSREDYEAMWDSIHRNGLWQGEIWDRHKDGHIYPKWLTISVVRDDQGRITHHIGSFTDITHHKAAEERINYLAHHDVLTRLPNRFSLQGRLEQVLATAQSNSGLVALMFIDLDRFKNINDTLGHHAGDMMLLEVAQRLKQCVRSSDIVARLGGDEFVVVLNEISLAMLPGIANKILNCLSEPYSINNHQLISTPSIGISTYPDDGDSVDELMKNADTAMYHAKSMGRNNYQFFTAAMNETAVERLALEGGLRQALEQNRFQLHYQPQIDIASGRPISVEALIRWTHPEIGMVPPVKFIPIAEETGLILPMGKWIIEEALGQLAAWRQAGIPLQRISVNLSAYQLRESSLQHFLAAQLARHGLDGSSLELEITESIAMQHPERTAELLGKLREMGIELAIDDFGTGYSSLAYLKQLPLNRLKLDRSFVMDILQDNNDATISAATISLAHNLGLAVVAEGVEEADQLAFLRDLDCDFAQGYYFSKPLPAEECAAVLRQMLASAPAVSRDKPHPLEYHL